MALERLGKPEGFWCVPGSEMLLDISRISPLSPLDKDVEHDHGPERRGS
jgi:hypothetical protein